MTTSRRLAARRRTGQHRLGTPGRISVRPGPALVDGPRLRARHSAEVPVVARRVRSTALVVALGTLLVSGWFVAAGATAFAQMLGP